MNFLFLGTGTSAGIPAIGCACEVCTSPDPRDRRLRTAGAITFTDPAGTPRVLFIDAGPDLRQQCLRENLTRCDGILLTHNHVDHTFGLDEVRRFNAVQRTMLDLYCEPHTAEFLHRVYQHIFDRANNINDSFVADILLHRILPAKTTPHEVFDPLRLYGLVITPLRLLHGRLPVLGYRIEPSPELESALPKDAERWWPLAYCTDVSAVPPGTFRGLSGLKTLVLDCLRRRHHPTHLTLDQALSLAERIGAERTYFVHMAHDLPHEATNAELPEGIQLAHDGLRLGSSPM